MILFGSAVAMEVVEKVHELKQSKLSGYIHKRRISYQRKVRFHPRQRSLVKMTTIY